jgi:hypothetical protein
VARVYQRMSSRAGKHAGTLVVLPVANRAFAHCRSSHENWLPRALWHESSFKPCLDGRDCATRSAPTTFSFRSVRRLPPAPWLSVTLHRFPSVNQAGARQHRPRAGGAGRASQLLIFISGPAVALRVSNWVAIGMLFLTGYIFVRSTGHRPLPLGCTMVLVGALLTGVAIGLGG